MCHRCDNYADQTEAEREPDNANGREDEPCPVGDHDIGEAAELPADWFTPAFKHTVFCLNCGWSVSDIEAREQADIDGAV